MEKLSGHILSTLSKTTSSPNSEEHGSQAVKSGVSHVKSVGTVYDGNYYSYEHFLRLSVCAGLCDRDGLETFPQKEIYAAYLTDWVNAVCPPPYVDQEHEPNMREITGRVLRYLACVSDNVERIQECVRTAGVCADDHSPGPSNENWYKHFAVLSRCMGVQSGVSVDTDECPSAPSAPEHLMGESNGTDDRPSAPVEEEGVDDQPGHMTSLRVPTQDELYGEYVAVRDMKQRNLESQLELARKYDEKYGKKTSYTASASKW